MALARHDLHATPPGARQATLLPAPRRQALACLGPWARGRAGHVLPVAKAGNGSRGRGSAEHPPGAASQPWSGCTRWGQRSCSGCWASLQSVSPLAASSHPCLCRWHNRRRVQGWVLQRPARHTGTTARNLLRNACSIHSQPAAIVLIQPSTDRGSGQGQLMQRFWSWPGQHRNQGSLRAAA